MKPILLLLLATATILNSNAKETCKIHVTVSDGTKPVELVIAPSGQDPAHSQYRSTIADGVYDCVIETDQVERYEISDLGQLIETGRTARYGTFLVEDGAQININLDGDQFEITSDGVEFGRWKEMGRLVTERFAADIEALDSITDFATEEAMTDSLISVKNQWELDYYAKNPMIYFLLDLNERLAGFRFNDHSLASRLDTYHEYYTDLYPEHNVHKSIAAAESAGLQIKNRKYNDFNIRTLDGEVVRMDSYLGDGYTLIICWATWCPSCRREAKDIIPLADKYRDKGLSVVGLAREFKSADALKSAVEEDNYPWPTLVDIDDEFKVFDNHGATSSALFLLDPAHTIIASSYDIANLLPLIENKLGKSF